MSRATSSNDDFDRQIAQIAGPLAASGLDAAAAAALVELVVGRSGVDQWVSHALDWIDVGVWSDGIEDALLTLCGDVSFSSSIRRRAWTLVVPRVLRDLVGVAPTEVANTSSPDAWLAELSDGRSVVVKRAAGSKNRPGSALVEAWAYTACAERGVSVPNVLAVSEDPECLVVERLAGSPLPQTDASSWAQLRSVWSRAGADLRAVHEISLAGFGPLVPIDGRPVGEAPAWSPLVEYAHSEGIRWLVDAGFLTSALGDRLQDRFDEAMPLIRSFPQGRLLHGDLQAEHIFRSSDGRYVGIIDFGSAQAGDPRWDLARVLLFDGDDALDAVLAGYGGDVLTNDDRDFLLPLYLFSLVVFVAAGNSWSRTGNDPKNPTANRRGRPHNADYVRLLLDRSRYQALL